MSYLAFVVLYHFPVHNLQQIINLLITRANSASYPIGTGNSRLRSDGQERPTDMQICSLLDHADLPVKSIASAFGDVILVVITGVLEK